MPVFTVSLNTSPQDGFSKKPPHRALIVGDDDAELQGVIDMLQH